MIEIKKKEDCCGCSACIAKCPKQCISFYQDEEGFLYPKINKNTCVECGVCECVCPMNDNAKVFSNLESTKEDIIHQALKTTSKIPECYVCYIREPNIRNESTSGGAFGAVSEYVLKKGGAVFGVALSSQNEVVHVKAESLEELTRLRRSKYVQSKQNDVYVNVRKELNSGKMVLYTGTPCQVEGLKNYLGKEYDNLITMDIFCHGVGSPLYWKKYLTYMEQEYQSAISKIHFREKTYGYNSATMALYFDNGKSSHRGHDDDLYWAPFSKNYIYRPSCYACEFKKVNHRSDFSIGDFWRTDDLPTEFKNANGCSLLLCHSTKASEILECVKSKLNIVPYDLEQGLIVNGGHQPSMLIASAPCPKRRSEFFNDMERLNPRQLNQKYMPLSMKKRIACSLKPMLYKLGILDLLKQVKKGGKRNAT